MLIVATEHNGAVFQVAWNFRRSSGVFALMVGVTRSLFDGFGSGLVLFRPLPLKGRRILRV